MLVQLTYKEALLNGVGREPALKDNCMVQLKWFPPSWVQISTRQAKMYIDPSYLKTYYAKHPTVIEYSTWPDPVDGLPEPLEPATTSYS